MKSRLLRLLLLTVFLGSGVVYYRSMLRPEPQRLEDWADQALKDIFGPGVVHAPTFQVDVLEGVTIERLKVQGLDDGPPALWADSIVVRHDPLALSAGVPRLRRVVVRGPHISMRELDSGEIKLDFPFEAPRAGGGRAMSPPSIVVENGTITLQANARSTRFSPGYRLVLENFHGEATPDVNGVLRISGGFTPKGIGFLPGQEITFSGTADPERGLLDLGAVWDALRLTPEVRGILAPDLAQQLDPARVEEGPHRLSVRFQRDPEVKAGRVRVAPEFEMKVRLDPRLLPGGEEIDAKTAEEIRKLFGQIDLHVTISGQDFDFYALASSLAGGTVRAKGTLKDGGKTSVELTITVTGLNLADPGFRSALGPTGEAVFSQFEARGTANAVISLRREGEGPFVWESIVEFTDASLTYPGAIDPVLKTPSGKPLRHGFPYEARHAWGRVHVKPGLVTFEPIEAMHGTARIRIRGATEKGLDGKPTGTVVWDPDGNTAVHLTIDAREITTDADLEAAIEGSELAGFLDKYRISGVIDRVVVDVVKAPDETVCVTETQVELSGESFTFGPFPLPMTDVSGSVLLLRPRLPSGERAREYHLDAEGRAGGGRVDVRAALLETEKRGRVKIRGVGIHMDGAFGKAVLASEAGKGGLGDAWRFLSPGGQGDIEADIPVFEDPDPEAWRVVLTRASVTLRPDQPLPGTEDATATIEGLRGVVTVIGGNVVVSNVTGTLEGSAVTVSGRLDGGTMGAWDLSIEAKRLGLSPALLAVIEGSSPCGDVFPEGLEVAPGGVLDLTVRLKRNPDPDGLHCTLSAEVLAKSADLTVKVAGLPVRVRGDFRALGDDLWLDGVTAEGEQISVRIPKAHVGPDGFEGSLTATLKGVPAGKDLLGLFPASVRPTIADLTKDRLLETSDLTVLAEKGGATTLSGSLTLAARPKAPAGGAPRGTITFSPLSIGVADAKGSKRISGLVRLDRMSLDLGLTFSDLVGRFEIANLATGDDCAGGGVLRIASGKISGLEVENLVAPMVLRGSVLTFAPLSTSIYGGRLAGSVSVHVKAPVAYEGKVDVTDLRLEALHAGVESKGPAVRGLASGHVEFQSRGPDTRDLTAIGNLSIREGDLGELPTFANIPALFGSMLPESQHPRFERAYLQFNVQDEVIHAEHLALQGPFFDMDGYGTLSFGGTLDLTLRPQFIKSMLLPGILQTPGIGDILGLLREDSLYIVRVQGDVSDAKPALVAFPFLRPRRAAPSPRSAKEDAALLPFEGKPERRVPHLFR